MKERRTRRKEKRKERNKEKLKHNETCMLGHFMGMKIWTRWDNRASHSMEKSEHPYPHKNKTLCVEGGRSFAFRLRFLLYEYALSGVRWRT